MAVHLLLMVVRVIIDAIHMTRMWIFTSRLWDTGVGQISQET